MRLKIVSDIHCDINKNYETNLNFNSDDFVICCGDISGDRFSTETWIKNNIKQGIVIGGNHLGYNHISYDKNDSLNLSIKYLQKQFNGPIYFLENQSLVIEDICFIGCILFTDFELYENAFECKYTAQKYLNDFRYVKLYKKQELKTISADDQLTLHKKSINFINKTCKKHKDKKVILITHHAPSIKSIAEEYKTDLLSAAFASNLEYIIEENNNIKLWCHGHVHSSFDYKLHDVRIIANPLGYGNENPQFNPAGIFVDTDKL